MNDTYTAPVESLLPRVSRSHMRPPEEGRLKGSHGRETRGTMVQLTGLLTKNKQDDTEGGEVASGTTQVRSATDSARLYSVPVLFRSPLSESSRLFFVNKPVSCMSDPTGAV